MNRLDLSDEEDVRFLPDIGYYWLVDRKPVEVKLEELLAWGLWMCTLERHVAESKVGDTKISTVFLGSTCRCTKDKKPLYLFETMTFGTEEMLPELRALQYKYNTWEEAEAGHKLIVEALTRNRKITADPGVN